MTCDQCPDVLPCWQGLLNRHPCTYCKRVEIRFDGGSWETYSPVVIVRTCPVDAPAPQTCKYDRCVCNQCRVTHGFSVKRSCPEARSYTYEE